ncbi:MAG: hypothetical protein EOO88_56990, partial [Pedobacter sp.]
MKKLYLLITASCVLLSCGSTRPKPSPGEEEAMYEVLNFCLANDSIIDFAEFLVDKCSPTEPLVNKNGLYLNETEGIDALLTKEDIAGLNRQYKRKPVFMIDSAKLARPVT